MKLPYSITRQLKRYDSKDGRQVLIRIRSKLFPDIEIPVYDHIEGKRVNISVKPEFWNKGYVTGGMYHVPLRNINKILDQTEHSVKDAIFTLLHQNISPTRENVLKLTYFHIYQDLNDRIREQAGELLYREDGGAFESHDDFLDFVERQSDPKFDELKRQAGFLKRSYILDFWDEFIKEHAPDSYNLAKSSICRYIEASGDNCLAIDFNSEWLKRYFTYIIKNGYTKKEKKKTVVCYYEISTILRHLKALRSFGNWLFKKKIIETEDYKRFELKEADSKKSSLIKYKSNSFKNTHALYKEEFDHLFFFDFSNSPSMDVIRDLFILQTWLGGLRKSDFFELTEDNIICDKDNNVNITFSQNKTDNKIINPANKNYVLPILKKYNNKLPSFPSPNHYNERLKDVFKAAGLNRKLLFRHEYSNQQSATEVFIEMWKKARNSWARNCAVSILVEVGYPDHYIMKFTGHEDEKMLRHYRDVHKKEIKDMLDEVQPMIAKIKT